jgi:hypothetical protein
MRALLAGERARLELLRAEAANRKRPILSPAATTGRCAAAGRSPAKRWRPTRWPSCEVLAEADITTAEQAGEEDDDEPTPEPNPGIHVQRDDQAR